jgi:hypothetical protein
MGENDDEGSYEVEDTKMTLAGSRCCKHDGHVRGVHVYTPSLRDTLPVHCVQGSKRHV